MSPTLSSTLSNRLLTDFHRSPRHLLTAQPMIRERYTPRGSSWEGGAHQEAGGLRSAQWVYGVGITVLRSDTKKSVWA